MCLYVHEYQVSADREMMEGLLFLILHERRSESGTDIDRGGACVWGWVGR